jgi:hypothetical protein
LKTRLLEIIKRNKKALLITLFVIIGVILVLKLPKKNILSETFFNSDDTEYKYSDGVKKGDTLEKFGFCANENYVIKDVADVRRTPNVAMYNSTYKLKFGTKVYTKNIDKENKNNIDVDESLLDRETKNGFVAIYSVKPVTLSDMPVGYIAIEDIIEKSEFKNFKPEPKEIERTKIETSILSTIESHLLIDEIDYKLIEDNNRFNNTITYGDFNDDGNQDFAIVLDKLDNSESILLVYAFNPEKNAYELIFKKAQPLLVQLKTIKKDTSISVNFEMTSFPLDGTFFQIYNTHDNTFMVFKN